MDLRELQKTGRIGRIEIELSSRQDKTSGSIEIPSSVDRASTAIIAAALEGVDRVGPCGARIAMDKIVDAREEKRRFIVDRAKDILQKWTIQQTPSTDELLKEVQESVKPSEVIGFGPEGLPAGPDVQSARSIIIVEGRADVINLLRCGIKNAVGVEGASVPESVIKLAKDKEITVFLDGDRGGDLIMKELAQVMKIDFVARAPHGLEVEELTPKDVVKILREKIPFAQVREERRPRREERREEKREERFYVSKSVMNAIEGLRGTLEAVLFNDKEEVIARIPVSELAEKLQDTSGIKSVVFDGVITQRIIDIASERGIDLLVADRISEITKRPASLKLHTFSDLASQ